jgi:ABC-2 type transport system ATP-binding protein
MDRDSYRKRLDFLVPAFGIGEFLDSPVRKLSLGQRMRAEVAASLLHSPEIVFLDEPTIGLDMVAKDALRDVINAENTEFGTTVLLTSHDIGDVERVCDRVIIVNHGKIVSDTTIADLRKNHVKTKVLKFHLASGTFSPGKGMSVISREGNEYVVETQNSPSALKKAIDSAYASGDVEDFSIEDPSLEDIIRTFY